MDEISTTTGQKDEAVILKRSEHIVSRRNIDPDALRILFRLHSLGFTGYLTGGAVRDMLLGKAPKDFDIVTNARPGQIRKYFPNVFIIGRRFRLAHVHFRGGKIIEVATFRKISSIIDHDNSDNKSNPENVFGSPHEDAFRRDITINALFYDARTASIIDYVGGIADLQRRCVRVIGDPGERFREDPVRIWRVVRYAARAEFNIAEDTLRAIGIHRHLLGQCSGARLFEEFSKDLIHKATRPVIEGMRNHGILRHILGRIGADYEIDANLFSRLYLLLDSEDRDKEMEGKPLLDEMCAIIFWPWVEPLFSGAQGDMHVILRNAFVNAGMAVTLPKSLRAQVIDILVMVGKMLRALRTGRMRWSLRGRPQYHKASRLCFLIEKKQLPENGESFESLFQQAFPQFKPNDQRYRRPRRGKQ